MLDAATCRIVPSHLKMSSFSIGAVAAVMCLTFVGARTAPLQWLLIKGASFTAIQHAPCNSSTCLRAIRTDGICSMVFKRCVLACLPQRRIHCRCCATHNDARDSR